MIVLRLARVFQTDPQRRTRDEILRRHGYRDVERRPRLHRPRVHR